MIPAVADPQAFTFGQNVRLRNRKVMPLLGAQALTVPPAFEARWVAAGFSATTPLILLAGQGKVFTLSGGSYVDITNVGGDYTENAQGRYTLELFDGLPIINNGIEVPQVWSPPLPATKLVDLPNWPAAYRCQSLRSFMSHLIALNVTKTSTVYPHLVAWSHPAEPGAVPTSWDITDPTLDAGEFTLADTDAGAIVDGIKFGTQFLILKESAVHAMRFVGGVNRFRVDGVTASYGLFAKDSLRAVPARKGIVFWVDQTALVAYDGNEFGFPFAGKLEDYFFDALDSTRKNEIFAVVNRAVNELQVFFPTENSRGCEQALVWNYKENTTTLRTSVGIAYAAAVIADNLSALISGADLGVPYSEEVLHAENIGFQREVAAGREQIVLEVRPALVEDTGEAFVQDVAITHYGQSPQAYVERLSLPVSNYMRQEYVLDFTRRKIISEVWPHITLGAVDVEIGVQESQQDTIVWSAPMRFNAGEKSVKLTRPAAGRFISVRFRQVGTQPFMLTGFDIEVDVLGES